MVPVNQDSTSIVPYKKGKQLKLNWSGVVIHTHACVGYLAKWAGVALKPSTSLIIARQMSAFHTGWTAFRCHLDVEVHLGVINSNVQWPNIHVTVIFSFCGTIHVPPDCKYHDVTSLWWDWNKNWVQDIAHTLARAGLVVVGKAPSHCHNGLASYRFTS